MLFFGVLNYATLMKVKPLGSAMGLPLLLGALSLEMNLDVIGLLDSAKTPSTSAPDLRIL